MAFISKKEFDLYGNLILDIQISRFVYKVGSQEFEYYKELLPCVIDIVGDIAVFTDGYVSSMSYDINNKILSEEQIIYSTGSYRRHVYKNIYLYSEDGKVLEETNFYYQIPIRGTTSEIDNFTKVIHYINKYDDSNNLVEITRYDFNLPHNADKIDIELCDNMISEKKQYKNIYNSQGHLVKIIDKRTDLVVSQFFYVANKLDKKIVFDNGKNDITVKYIYNFDSIDREEYYSKSEVLLKIIMHEIICERLCLRLISPANDNFRWYFLSFDESECTLVVEEEILTFQMLESIYNYIMTRIKTKISFCIYLFNTHNIDPTTFSDENEVLINKYRVEQNIDFIYT